MIVPATSRPGTSVGGAGWHRMSTFALEDVSGVYARVLRRDQHLELAGDRVRARFDRNHFVAADAVEDDALHRCWGVAGDRHVLGIRCMVCQLAQQGWTAARILLRPLRATFSKHVRLTNTDTMLQLILKRIALGFVTLWILSVIVFLAAQILPGDPARAILGPLASPQAVKVLQHQLGTDRSVWAQYGTWIGHIFQGNFGMSFAYQSAIGRCWDGTRQLAEARRGWRFVIVVPLGVLGGIVSALNGRAAAR